jgi:hypothetical protein
MQSPETQKWQTTDYQITTENGKLEGFTLVLGHGRAHAHQHDFLLADRCIYVDQDINVKPDLVQNIQTMQIVQWCNVFSSVVVANCPVDALQDKDANPNEDSFSDVWFENFRQLLIPGGLLVLPEYTWMVRVWDIKSTTDIFRRNGFEYVGHLKEHFKYLAELVDPVWDESIGCNVLQETGECSMFEGDVFWPVFKKMQL